MQLLSLSFVNFMEHPLGGRVAISKKHGQQGESRMQGHRNLTSSGAVGGIVGHGVLLQRRGLVMEEGQKVNCEMKCEVPRSQIWIDHLAEED